MTNGGKNELTIEPTGIVILEGKSPYETGELQPITLGMVGMTGGEPVDPPVDLAAAVAALRAEMAAVRTWQAGQDARWVALAKAATHVQ